MHPRRLVMVLIRECDFCTHPVLVEHATNMCYVRVPYLQHTGWQVCYRPTCIQACEEALRAFEQEKEEAQAILVHHQVVRHMDDHTAWIPRSHSARTEQWYWTPHAVTRVNPLFHFQNDVLGVYKLLTLQQLIEARLDRRPERLALLQPYVAEVLLLPELYPLVLDYM